MPPETRPKGPARAQNPCKIVNGAGVAVRIWQAKAPIFGTIRPKGTRFRDRARRTGTHA